MKPHHVIVLLNTSSGKVGGEGRDQLRAALESAFEKHAMSASLEFLPSPDLRSGAERALQRITRGEINAVIVGGGDGSIRTIAGVLAESGAALGIIPLGTRNHFARDLEIPLSIDEAVAVIAAGVVRAVESARSMAGYSSTTHQLEYIRIWFSIANGEGAGRGCQSGSP